MHRVEFESRARKEFLGLPKEVQHDLTPLINLLQENPRPLGCKKLKGVGEYRLRKGDYRVLYTVSDKEQVIRVYRIIHRRNAYR